MSRSPFFPIVICRWIAHALQAHTVGVLPHCGYKPQARLLSQQLGTGQHLSEIGTLLALRHSLAVGPVDLVHQAPLLFLAGADGIEPPNVGIKIRCLTTWRRPYRFESLIRLRLHLTHKHLEHYAAPCEHCFSRHPLGPCGRPVCLQHRRFYGQALDRSLYATLWNPFR